MLPYTRKNGIHVKYLPPLFNIISHVFPFLCTKRYEKPHKQKSATHKKWLPRMCFGKYFQNFDLPNVKCGSCRFVSYNSTPPSDGVRNWNVVLPSLLVMRKSVSVIMSMPSRRS